MLLSQLKVLAAVALAVAVAAAGTVVWVRQALADKPAAAAKEEAPKDKDQEKIVGTWAYESVEVGGQKVPEEQVKGGGGGAKMTLTAEGKFTVIRGGKEVKGTYKLDPAKKPKGITTTNDEGKTHNGIYKLDGDALTLCIPEEAGAEPPTEFATKEGTKVVLVVLKREKK